MPKRKFQCCECSKTSFSYKVIVKHHIQYHGYPREDAEISVIDLPTNEELIDKAKKLLNEAIRILEKIK